MKIHIKLLSGALLALMTIASCTKTEDLPARTQSSMLSFAVTNLPDTLIYGVVDQTDHTITVYLPFYYNLNIIDPQIKVSEGASVLEELLPVNVNDSTQQYTVKGKDSSVTVYKLKIYVQPPGVPFVLTEISTADSYYETWPGYGQFSITGSFYTLNAKIADAWLVDKSGAEHPLTLTAISSSGDASTGTVQYWLSGIPVPSTLDSGLYHVKAAIYGRTATMQYPIRVAYRQPDFGYFTTREVKQGDKFTLVAHVSSGKVFTGVKSFAMSADGVNWLPLIVESYNREEAVIKVPEDFPTGAYQRYRMEFDTWDPIVRSGSFTTITAK
ncbi:hypothetical protein [Chitinophaga cymbidii]|uniref:DUF1735 domain-containing protein n=1 Tax=Chitinophaga cymbidii TaxID=1096750 RepID=A0A512REC4_9BACT|nr:hypothetical protein [Chitinophaga cymbidii]GEP94056.1 hypothetical protein CCY01nite_03160 [Chitinophaga cymbidii]